MSLREARDQLIDEVRRRPVLYDTSHEAHRDQEARDQCWAAIADKLATTSDVAKHEWKILRDSLRQSLRNSGKKGRLAQRPWRFQRNMAFIIPYMTKRGTREIRTKRMIKADVSPSSPAAADLEPLDAETWNTPHHPEDDSLELFFASVCQSVKRFPPRMQHQVKRQVLDVLIKVEEDFVSSDAPVDSKPGLFGS